jgi:superfamily II DNA/RNA helicase
VTAFSRSRTGQARLPAAAPTVASAASTFACLTRPAGDPWRHRAPRGRAPVALWAAPVQPIAPKTVDAKPIDTVTPVTDRRTPVRPDTARRPETEAVPASVDELAAPSASLPAEAMPTDWRFGELELTEPVARAVWNAGYRAPTPIQARCVPILLGGGDIVGQAQTGTGKTAAFGLPIVERIDPSVRQVQALILVPTRELCRQVTGELTRLGTNRGIDVLAVYGGEGMDRQLKGLANGAHVVVGTPGRVQDHLWRGTLALTGLRIAVLDEADEMLDIGFAEAIERIISWMPRERQTCLFSATVPPFVARLVRRYLKDPEWVSTIEQTGATRPVPTQIRQSFVTVAERDKLEALDRLVKSEGDYDRVLVFRRMKIYADRLAEAMQRRGYVARALHGDLPQGERNRVLDDFRSGKIRFLIATNVAARGLDIEGVSHVLNFDLPDTPEEYVHRIGRTGRAGRQGTAVTFVSEWDFEAFEPIRERGGPGLIERDLGLYAATATPPPSHSDSTGGGEADHTADEEAVAEAVGVDGA